MSSKKVIVWKSQDFQMDTLKDSTHKVTSLHIDNSSGLLTIGIQKGNRVEQVAVTMEQAQQIGFINFNALDRFCS